MVIPETSPVAIAGLASGECSHHARMTTWLVVACLTPRGASVGMGCLAGLVQSGRLHAQRPSTAQYTGRMERPWRACARADWSRGLAVASEGAMAHCSLSLIVWRSC